MVGAVRCRMGVQLRRHRQEGRLLSMPGSALARVRKTGIGTLSALALLAASPAVFGAEPNAADLPDPGTPVERAQDEPEAAEPIETEAPEPRLLGDLGGLRPALAKHGIDLGLSYIGETFGVVHGGVKRGAIYEGQAGVALGIDLDKLIGWSGGKIYANALNIHGR